MIWKGNKLPLTRNREQVTPINIIHYGLPIRNPLNDPSSQEIAHLSHLRNHILLWAIFDLGFPHWGIYPHGLSTCILGYPRSLGIPHGAYPHRLSVCILGYPRSLGILHGAYPHRLSSHLDFPKGIRNPPKEFPLIDPPFKGIRSAFLLQATYNITVSQDTT